MNKKELLYILYAERNRLVSNYTRPGWTSWAIIGAIATLVWSIINLLIEESFSCTNSAVLFYFLFNFFLALLFPFLTFKKEVKPPVFGTGDKSSQIGIVYFTLIYVAQFILLLMLVNKFSPLIFYPIIVLNGLLVLIFLVTFITSFIPMLRTEKNNKIAGFLCTLVFCSFVCIWAIYLYKNSSLIHIIDVKLSILLFAISFLIGCFQEATPQKLVNLDKLITKTLYDKEPQEENVLAELEKCIIGFKYGDFLITEYYDKVTTRTYNLYTDMSKLNEMLSDSDDYSENIILFIKQTKSKATKLLEFVNVMINMIKLGYNKTDIDPVLTPFVKLMNNSVEIISMWSEIELKCSTLKYSEFVKYVLLKKQEIDVVLTLEGRVK